MSCYWFNRNKILRKAWGNYHNSVGKKLLLSITEII